MMLHREEYGHAKKPINGGGIILITGPADLTAVLLRQMRISVDVHWRAARLWIFFRTPAPSS